MTLEEDQNIGKNKGLRGHYEGRTRDLGVISTTL